MYPIAKSSFSTAIFFGIAAIFVAAESFPLGTAAFASLGVIQILNSAAPRLPFPRFLHWIHAMTFECLALLGVALLRLIPISKKRVGKGIPILLVHGYINNGSVWKFQKMWLESRGLGPIFVINLGHPFRSLSTYAEKVKAKAEEIAKETGRKELILIGHSMGGLVSSWYATRLAPENSVTDVITIGSPLFGTPMAYLGLGPNAREMRPGSPFIEELRSAIGENRKIRFRHIATRCDQLVIPGDSAVIPENQNYILEDIGHASLLYSTRVANKIQSWLKK